MMFDFSDIPFFDNHTHLLNATNRTLDLKNFMGPLNHGYVDQIPNSLPFLPNDNAGDNKPQWISDDMFNTVTLNTGIAQSMLHSLSGYFGCEETFAAVLDERNRRSEKDMMTYIEELYKDQKIIAEIVDESLPVGDPALKCFPCNVYRLYQTDPLTYRLIDECKNYDELLDRFDETLRSAITSKNYIGVKCHVLELNKSRPHYVSSSEAVADFSKAKSGDSEARESVYMAIFCHMMTMTQELNFPVHVHTGMTGKAPYKNINNNDPLCFIELLNDTRFVNSHLVLLHVGYPYVRSAAVMTATYPNVWTDFAQVLPWEVINFPNILEEIMGFAPFSKITFGSGAHGNPEINWMAAKVAKKSLAVVMERAVEYDFLSKEQAINAAELMLHKNSERLYGLEL